MSRPVVLIVVHGNAGSGVELDTSSKAVGTEEATVVDYPLAIRAALQGKQPDRIADRISAKTLFDSQPFENFLTRAEWAQRKETDFDGKVRENCRVHVLAPISPVDAERHDVCFTAVVDALTDRGLPFLVHAISEGSMAPPRSIWNVLEPLEEGLARREPRRGTLATIQGRTYANDVDLDWPRVELAFEAVVWLLAYPENPDKDAPPRPDPRIEMNAYRMLENAYLNDVDDDTLVPTRIDPYDGVFGGMAGDTSKDLSIAWRWTANDMLVYTGGDSATFDTFARLLTRTELPDDKAKLVTFRQWNLIAFDEDSMLSLAPIPSCPAIPCVYDRPEKASILDELVEREVGCAVFAIGNAARVEIDPLLDRRKGDSAKLPCAVSTRDDVAKIRDAITEAGKRFVVVSCGNDKEAADAARASLAGVDCVRATLTISRGRAAFEGDDLKITPTRAWLSVDGAELESETGSITDVAATLTELLGMSDVPSGTGRSLVRRA